MSVITKTFNFPFFFLIGIGGSLGALTRYCISLIPFSDGFPFPTLIVNWIGCFSLAYIVNCSYIKTLLPKPILTGITTGFIGSFTTFSAITIETVTLLENNVPLAFLYILLNLLGGLFLCFMGYKVATRKVESN